LSLTSREERWLLNANLLEFLLLPSRNVHVGTVAGKSRCHHFANTGTTAGNKNCTKSEQFLLGYSRRPLTDLPFDIE